jgi:NAD-reducing hydrogenase small subunit
MDPVRWAPEGETAEEAPPPRPRVATVWLGGCSGCHMSFLDMDERLLELAGAMELVYSPILDVKRYPSGVDVALVEGAVANEEHLHTIREVRSRTRFLVAFGDCAVTGNVTALRNVIGSAGPVLERAYLENATLRPRLPCAPGIVPRLLERVRSLGEVVPIDLHLPGCPPSADLIHFAVTELLAGRTPDLTGRLRYG